MFVLINCCGCFAAAQAHSTTDSLLNELNKVLAHKQWYVNKKEQKIAQLKLLLTQPQTPNAHYDIYQSLYEQYKSFRYDSAYYYSKKLQTISAGLHDPGLIASAKIKVAFTLLSSGLFKETLDELNHAGIEALPEKDKADYYFLKARCYFDLSDYDRSRDFTAIYDPRGIRCIDSALALSGAGSFSFLELKGLKELREGNYAGGEQTYIALLNLPRLSPHDFAVNASSLSYVYERRGLRKQAMELLIRAAIADIESATKETVAMYRLADMLYKKGDLKHAYSYIKQAMDDATFYGALQRQAKISSILPIIEAQWINQIEYQKKLLYAYSIIITLLVVFVVWFAVIIFRQLKKLRIADDVIRQANDSLQENNEALEKLNSNLSTANKIKNEYIGYYFNINSGYIDRLERFQRSLEKKLDNKRYEDALAAVRNLDLEHERQQLFHTFDSVFLKLFPDFIDKFNSLFNPGEEIAVPDGQLLATEHRIFALIRMGIHENDRIATLLGYSVNTIYSYKNRVKTRSVVANDEFEGRIMEIEAV